MRKAALERDWTKGSIVRNLLALGWPIVVTDSLRMVGPTIDLIWVGKLGAAAIAGVGVGGTIVMLLTAAKNGLNTGARALIARYIGAGDRASANHVAQQAFILSCLYALVVGVGGILFAEEMLRLMGLEADVVREGAAYMRIMFLNQAFNGFLMLCEAIMQASGDAVTPMKITIIARSIHLVLDPFLIFGWWLFPYMGVQGAAMANLIGYILGTSYGLWFLLSGRTRLRVTFRGFRFDLKVIWSIVKIGIPASISGMERNLGRLLLLKIVAPFGTLAVAAYSVCQRMEQFFHMPSMAFGMAAGVLSGQNLGAGQPDRAEKGGWLATGLVESIMVPVSVALLLWPQYVVYIFTSEPELVGITSTFLRIEAVGYLLMGFNFTLQACLNGAGDTLPPMLVVLLTMWGVQLPMAYFLPKITNLGVYAVPWAIAAGIIVGAITYTIYFRTGRWKRKKV